MGKSKEIFPSTIDQLISKNSLAPKSQMPSECKICSAKKYCNGNCWSMNFLENGSPTKPHKLSCEMRKLTVTAIEQIAFSDKKVNEFTEMEIKNCLIFCDQEYCSCESCEDRGDCSFRDCTDSCLSQYI